MCSRSSCRLRARACEWQPVGSGARLLEQNGQHPKTTSQLFAPLLTWRSALRQGVEALVGAHPAAHPLLPTANAGLVLVSWCAAGVGLQDSQGVP